MIDPVSLIGVNAATGLLHSIFAPSKSATSPSFDSVMKKHNIAELQKAHAAELVGAKVRVENALGEMITGIVEQVGISEEGVQLQINGQSYGLDQLRNVLSPKKHQGVKV
ncbi:MAG: hypothetical protein ACOY3I_05805 [Verrucomicrobiota bacterium]